MESKSEALNSKIIIGDLKNDNHLTDLITILSEYRIDYMGVCVPYNSKEITQLKSKLLEQKSIIIFLSYIDDKVIGASVCFKGMSTFTTKSLINIHDICVLKEYRGRGLGRQLMTFVIEYAKTQDCSKVTLEVREDNGTARKLYRSLMFKESTPVMNFWSKQLSTWCNSK